MAYKQVKGFDQSKAGSKVNECLKNVRLGFSIGPKYSNAWKAWVSTDQHTSDVPRGVDVPVYFWWKDTKNGHVGVRLANGKFWSDGKTYESIAVYVAEKEPSYRGWSTKVNGVQVIEYTPDPPPQPSKRVPKKIYLRPTTSAYAFYRPGTPLPVKRVNRAGDLNPRKWNGITYTNTVSTVDANTFEVVSPSLGNIIIWCGDSDSVVTY